MQYAEAAEVTIILAYMMQKVYISSKAKDYFPHYIFLAGIKGHFYLLATFVNWWHDVGNTPEIPDDMKPTGMGWDSGAGLGRGGGDD